MARGDLMFFLSRRGPIAHVAIYLGDNQYIEAADAGVKISSLDPKDKNYEEKRAKAFAFARRVIE
jgi:cell wall-associated NlpC family hydrolase